MMRVVLNSKCCEVPDGSTLCDLRKHQPSVRRDEILLEDDSLSGSRRIGDRYTMKDCTAYSNIPRIGK